MLRLNQEEIARGKVLVVGDVMLDRYWFGDVERISPEAPVPVCRIRRMDERLGGAANVAHNLATLGASCCLIGVIGNDEPGKCVQTLLHKLDIQDGLIVEEDIPTIIKLRVLGKSQQLVRLDFEETPGHEVLAATMDRYQQQIEKSDVVVLSDYGKGGLRHIQEMISVARQYGKPVIVDPKGADYERYRNATVITPNRDELAQVVGKWKTEEELERKAQTLRKSLAVQYLLLTRSEEGMSLFSETEVRHFPAEAKDVFDVSGAGDAVVATLAAVLAAGYAMPEAIPLSNRAGGVVVGKVGTAPILFSELFYS